MKNLFQRIADLHALFPAGVNVLSECMEHGVAELRLRGGGIFKVAASYDPDGAAIELDPKLDREKIAGVLTRRHGIRVEASEVHAWLFWHELSHHLRRLPGGGVVKNPEEELRAELYAKKRFLEWRKT